MKKFEHVRSQLKEVPLVKMRVCDSAQRDLKPSRVDFLAAEFDPEMFGYPVVSYRDGHYYIIDGQHRVRAVIAWLGKGWEAQSVTCRVYTGMSEQDEADMFCRLNDILTVGAFPKFKARVTAGSEPECSVKRTVEKTGLRISQGKEEGTVSAVSTLTKVYRRDGAATLSRCS